MALADLLEWNKRCERPESEATLKRNFEAYWKPDYKLHGVD